ncbi:hypothetical protein LK994_02535 [Ferruginibacter lapsinanis]|uniref:hypothetical protein n=1 Tax=Ferruginibacter lapsinanis TaxID=563172 RepID=UPI001E51FD53|nr:hypothetical protein [Ferruginibacter lapsinanis]UEG50351.1 hypothetical protein LK994_02535 [Ferruginibacter lapsinanis]
MKTKLLICIALIYSVNLTAQHNEHHSSLTISIDSIAKDVQNNQISFSYEIRSFSRKKTRIPACLFVSESVTSDIQYVVQVFDEQKREFVTQICALSLDPYREILFDYLNKGQKKIGQKNIFCPLKIKNRYRIMLIFHSSKYNKINDCSSQWLEFNT